MLTHWIPWKLIIRRAARAHGFIDPLGLLARLRQFAQPSEIQEPIELLRAGIVFHARGLVNAKAIQQNLDWIWPYWVEKQFNPRDPSFIPRAFSISHINLTHRNWTAAGIPDSDDYPLVDPRGLVTPFYDGWSLDFWLVSSEGDLLAPSRSRQTEQKLHLTPNLRIDTTTSTSIGTITTQVTLERENRRSFVRIACETTASSGDLAVVAVRPYNPEGIQFVEKIVRLQGNRGLRINGENEIRFQPQAREILLSEYAEGDVLHKLQSGEKTDQKTPGVQCKVGMATAAAVFPVDHNDRPQKIRLQIPLTNPDNPPDCPAEASAGDSYPPAAIAWKGAMDGTAGLQIPDEKMQFLYDAALRTLLLLSAKTIVPGPFTYKRFWYRDAALMLHALLVTGCEKKCARLLETFPAGQKASGYFQSQEGEWDSNGQVLWIVDRFQALTGRELDKSWKTVVKKAARWIDRKRLTNARGQPHNGLLPAGFSAEHLGPNDYYYWDNFWAIAGMQAAARIMKGFGEIAAAETFSRQAADFQADLEKSLAQIPEQRKKGCLPASPYRRLDPGAIGSLVADYPLSLYPPKTPSIINTARFLMENCFQQGGFFQDMIHSGINAYLTLAIAQTLLRYGDSRYQELIRTVAALASSTGQWPEAIHPITGGGCMGDGQHGWAAAEWVMMIRNLFLREEGHTLVVGSGIFPEWLQTGRKLSFGPGLTPFGPVTVYLAVNSRGVELTLAGATAKPLTFPEYRLEARVPGFRTQSLPGLNQPIILQPE